MDRVTEKPEDPMKYPMSFFSYNTGTEPFPQHRRTQRPPVLQMFSPHLLVCTQTWQGKVDRETLNPSSLTCSPVSLLSKKCESQVAVDGVLKDASPNYVNVNGEKQKMHTFVESFTHHVDLLWVHGDGLSWNMTQTQRGLSALCPRV